MCLHYNLTPKSYLDMAMDCHLVFSNTNPLYERIAVLVQPTALSRSKSGKEIMFYLTNSNLQAIIGSSYFTDDELHLAYDAHQVHVRFCLVNADGVDVDVFPPNLIMRLNGSTCPLPCPIKKKGETQNKDNPVYPRMPINVTRYLNLSTISPNKLFIMWDTRCSQKYFVTVQLVRPYTPEELQTRLSVRGIRRPEYTVGLIKDKLSEGNSEIAALSLRVSLSCPLSLKRIATPCRAKQCEHLQCFDGVSYLELMEKKPKWLCPVCDRKLKYDDLIIDGYFTDVLSSLHLPPDATEIFLHQDGTWSTSRDKDSSNSYLPSTPAHLSSQVTITKMPEKSVVDITASGFSQDNSDACVSSSTDLEPQPSTSQFNADCIPDPSQVDEKPTPDNVFEPSTCHVEESLPSTSQVRKKHLGSRIAVKREGEVMLVDLTSDDGYSRRKKQRDYDSDSNHLSSSPSKSQSSHPDKSELDVTGLAAGNEPDDDDDDIVLIDLTDD